MGIKHYRPYTPSRRNMTSSTYEEITKKSPEKSLLETKKKKQSKTYNYKFPLLLTKFGSLKKHLKEKQFQ